jgi:PmbA protein
MKTIIQETINQVLDLGADACDIIVDSGESLSLSAYEGKIKKFQLSKTKILGVRAIKNKKIGLAYSESFDKDALLFAAKAALENAEYSDINEFEKVQINNQNNFFHDESQIDPSTIEEKIEMVLKLESEVKRRDPRVQSAPYNGVSSSESKSYYMNSLGTYTELARSSISAHTSALIKEGENTSMHYAYVQARNLTALNIEQCIEESLEHASNWLTAKPVSTGRYDVVFSTETLSEIIGVFSSNFSAKDAIDKVNMWESKIGQSVAASSFTMIDSPLYKDAFTKYPVDSEGMVTKDLTLIENGILKSFYHNTSTANHFGLTSTGHAARGARSSLNVSATNWLILPGHSSESEVKDGTYLEIISLMGTHSGADSVSGEFSFGASGYLCKNGIRVQPVKGITIAGNFNKLLGDISCMGSEVLACPAKSTFSPLIKFSNLAVAGS